MTSSGSQLGPDVLADLLCAMLAVNNLPLEDTVALHPALEREGLFDLPRLSRMAVPELFAALRRAGYPKSDYVTGLVANWLHATASALAADQGRRLAGLLASGPSDELDRYLLSLKGVGTVVLRNFKILREASA